MMATALISGVFSVVGKALAPLKDGLLKDWAASVELGDNVEALELELLSAKAVLEHTVGKEIADNSAFRELLVRLQDLGYDADDVLDELDYFRIQDQLHGTSAAADRHAKGFIHNMALHAKAVGKQFICLPTCFSPNTKPSAGDDDNRGIDTSVQTINHRNDEPPELIFNRIEASKRMQHIVLWISGCPELSLFSDPHDDSKNDGRTGGGGLQGEGLLSLLVHGCLTKLIVIGTPNFFVDSYPSRVHEQELPPCSSKPQFFSTDDVAGVTAAPICRLLVSSLTKLRFSDMVVECFTEEQEILLFVNSLEEITFDSCNNLLCLPERLHRLPNLKRLEIYGCKAIQVLPKDSLPSSLQELEIKDCQEIRSLPEDGLPSSLQQICIEDCPDIQSMPEDGLPSSLQRLRIKRCSAIQSLPKVDDLPSTLRELDIKDCGNEELKRQCRRLIGIIPIVRA
nr:unnamed protein product [Digitaria exilis]